VIVTSIAVIAGAAHDVAGSTVVGIGVAVLAAIYHVAVLIMPEKLGRARPVFSNAARSRDGRTSGGG
jgi:hypothetical protein